MDTCAAVVALLLHRPSPSGADPGLKKRGGGSNIFDVAKYIGAQGVRGRGVACMSTLRHSYRDSVILETKIFVI